MTEVCTNCKESCVDRYFSFLSIAVIKFHDQKPLGEERAYLILQEAGTEAMAMGECYLLACFYGLLSL